MRIEFKKYLLPIFVAVVLLALILVLVFSSSSTPDDNAGATPESSTTLDASATTGSEPSGTTQNTEATGTTDATTNTEATEGTVQTDNTVPSGTADVTEATSAPETTEPSATEPVQTEVTEPSASEPAETEPTPTVVHTHSYTESYTPPACHVFGYYTYTCECGHSYSKDDTSIPPNDHSYEYTFAPYPGDPFAELVTCVCRDCGDTYTHRSIAREVDPAVLDQIEERTIYYINQYRLAEGTPACEAPPVFQLVADYRAKQLLDNFAHDTGDLREATAYYKYGKYIDWAEYGCPDLVSENYYTFGGGEAIAKGFKRSGDGSVESWVDGTAKCLADLIYGSKNHWNYIGSANEITMACGIAWEHMEIVGVVMVSSENYG